MWQPSRQGLRGLASFGFGPTGIGPPVGAGAGAGAEIGASQGASIGSAIVPGIGTAVGALVGAIGGAIAGSLNKRDPEQANFDQAVALWQQNPDNIYAIGNKYLPLAGLFDLSLKNPHIPIYQRYGRMGEQRFVNDLVQQVYSAAQSGRISAQDTPLTIMSRIVQPWIDSWGYGPMVDPHADLINRLIVGLIMDYVLGRQTSWRARSGDYPFGNLPAFSLPTAGPPMITLAPAVVQAQPTVAPAPSLPSQAIVVGPVGSPTTPAATPTPSQLVSVPPAIGATVSYAPDLSAGGAPFQLPGGLVYVGMDPNNHSWVLQNPQTRQHYVLWQGAVTPYTPTMFAAAGGGYLPQSTTVATTSSGAPVTQADLQNLVSQLMSQGQTPQQAAGSAIQSLQSSGVAPTPAVTSAVQSAVDSTPASAAGFGAGMPSWATAAIVGGGLLFLLVGPTKKTRRARR